jgi:predicted  nucleic acid-binding Zn-ribbon protein
VKETWICLRCGEPYGHPLRQQCRSCSDCGSSALPRDDAERADLYRRTAPYRASRAVTIGGQVPLFGCAP